MGPATGTPFAADERRLRSSCRRPGASAPPGARRAPPGPGSRHIAARLLGTDAPEREVVYAESLFGERVDGWAPLHALRSSNEKFVDAPEAACRVLLRAEATPDHPDALFNRAKLEILVDKIGDARRDLNRLLATHADYPAARFLEAHLCLAEKNNDGAKEALTNFLALPGIDPRMKTAATDMLQKLAG